MRQIEIVRITEEIGAGAGIECGADGSLVIVFGEDDDRSGGMPVEDGRTDLRTWAIWKLEVQHHDVGLLLGRGGDRIQPGGCLGDNEPIVARQLGQDSLSHEPVTLDDQNARRHLTGMVVVFSSHPVGGSRTRKAGSVPSRAAR